LPFVNLAITAYIWGKYITHSYDTEDSFEFYKLYTVFIFANLLVTFPFNWLHFEENLKRKLYVESAIVAIQAYLAIQYGISVRHLMNSKSGLFFHILFTICGINIAAVFPLVSDIILIIVQYISVMMYTNKYAQPSLLVYYGPLCLLGEAVAMSFGISQLQRCKKTKTDNFQAILGLNDSQLSYVLLIIFAVIMNSMDYFQGIGHLAPLLTFPLAIPAMYTQLDCNHTVAKTMTMIFFVLYTCAYHIVKVLIANPQFSALLTI